MKKALLSGALLVLMAVAAEAQVYVEYNRRTRDSSLRVTYSGGYYYGYGYGSFGYGGGPAFGPRYGMPYGGSYGTAVHYGSPFGGYSYYSGPVHSYPPYYAPWTVMDYSPPRPIVRGAADRNPALLVAKEVEEGRRRLRAGDYAGAVDSFREAVAADTSSASAQAWFALSLAVAGDFRNADKALRGAAERAPFEKIDLKDLFKDARERARVLGLMGRAPADGSLAAAWIRFLDGDRARLTQLAEKDAGAKKLLAP